MDLRAWTGSGWLGEYQIWGGVHLLALSTDLIPERLGRPGTLRAQNGPFAVKGPVWARIRWRIGETDLSLGVPGRPGHSGGSHRERGGEQMRWRGTRHANEASSPPDARFLTPPLRSRFYSNRRSQTPNQIRPWPSQDSPSFGRTWRRPNVPSIQGSLKSGVKRQKPHKNKRLIGMPSHSRQTTIARA